MKASKFTDAQKAFIIRQGDEGTPVADICRKAGISQATYFNWKKKYAGMMPSEMKRLRELEEENGRLYGRCGTLARMARLPPTSVAGASIAVIGLPNATTSACTARRRKDDRSIPSTELRNHQPNPRSTKPHRNPATSTIREPLNIQNPQPPFPKSVSWAATSALPDCCARTTPLATRWTLP